VGDAKLYKTETLARENVLTNDKTQNGDMKNISQGNFDDTVMDELTLDKTKCVPEIDIDCGINGSDNLSVKFDPTHTENLKEYTNNYKESVTDSAECTNSVIAKSEQNLNCYSDISSNCDNVLVKSLDTAVMHHGLVLSSVISSGHSLDNFNKDIVALPTQELCSNVHTSSGMIKSSDTVPQSTNLLSKSKELPEFLESQMSTAEDKKTKGLLKGTNFVRPVIVPSDLKNAPFNDLLEDPVTEHTVVFYDDDPSAFEHNLGLDFLTTNSDADFARVTNSCCLTSESYPLLNNLFSNINKKPTLFDYVLISLANNEAISPAILIMLTYSFLN